MINKGKVPRGLGAPFGLHYTLSYVLLFETKAEPPPWLPEGDVQQADVLICCKNCATNEMRSHTNPNGGVSFIPMHSEEFFENVSFQRRRDKRKQGSPGGFR